MRAPKGQNFLYQREWLARVAAAVGPGDAVLEIGGGPGGLTALLARQSRRLWVVELDAALAAGLRQQGFQVIEGDILELDLSALAVQEGVERWQVAGNLPYYITSPILLHLFRHAGRITTATILVQREVAERLAAQPGTRAFGLLTVTAQLYAQVERLFDIPPGAFRPRPQVHSSLLRLTMKPQAAALGVEEAPFLAFLRRGFAHKRKQLAGFLGNPERAGLPAKARAEELTLAEWARLYRTLE